MSLITNLTIVYSTVYSDADQREHQRPRHWPLWGEFTGTGEFPAQMASNAENVSIWWRHHPLYVHGIMAIVVPDDSLALILIRVSQLTGTVQTINIFFIHVFFSSSNIFKNVLSIRFSKISWNLSVILEQVVTPLETTLKGISYYNNYKNACKVIARAITAILFHQAVER